MMYWKANPTEQDDAPGASDTAMVIRGVDGQRLCDMCDRPSTFLKVYTSHLLITLCTLHADKHGDESEAVLRPRLIRRSSPEWPEYEF